MRLSLKQIKQIKESTASVFGEEAKVYLFGSRLDDSSKGGGILICWLKPINTLNAQPF